jgi:hypothetical protein
MIAQSAAHTDASAITAVETASTKDENANARRYAQGISEGELWQAKRQCVSRPHFAYPPGQPFVWVKFRELDRLAEADMQRLAWQWVRSERMAGRCANIHIPEVFKTLTSGEHAFIIMELLDATLLSKSVFACPIGSLHPVQQCYDLIAEGIQLLRRMPVRPDATPGPYTPDHKLRRIKHPMFKEGTAATLYGSVDELENHINKVTIAVSP